MLLRKGPFKGKGAARSAATGTTLELRQRAFPADPHHLRTSQVEGTPITSAEATAAPINKASHMSQERESRPHRQVPELKPGYRSGDAVYIAGKTRSSLGADSRHRTSNCRNAESHMEAGSR